MFKKLILIIPFLLAGCESMPWYLAPYDSGEMEVATRVQTLNNFVNKNCSNPNEAIIYVNTLDVAGDWMINYSSHLPANENLIQIEKELNLMIDELVEKYQDGKSPSKFYCEEKTKNINQAVTNALDVISNKDR